MENKAAADQSQRIYQDFEPFCKWHGRDMVELHLLGFRKEHLKVQTNSMGILTIHGERPLKETNGNIWSRFHKEIKLSNKCDPDDVRAKLNAAGVLTVTMPLAHDDHKVPKTSTTTADHQHEKVVPAAADQHNKNNIDKQKPAAPATTNYDQSSDYDANKPTSCEFKGQRVLVSRRLKVGKDVAVKLVAAVAVILAFGFGAYVVKYYK